MTYGSLGARLLRAYSEAHPENIVWTEADGWRDAPELSLQFCHAGQNLDITGWPSRDLDAGEVRLWAQDGTLIAAVTRNGDGTWDVTGSDAARWTDLDGSSPAWRDAMERVTSRAGYQIPAE